jgi:CheY-like chemotaxis protein
MEAVGRMTAGIAHDFNNVLSVILAGSQLIADSLGSDAGDAVEDVALVRASAGRGAAMVGKLLGFSRAAPLKVEPTDLMSLVESLGSMVRHLVPEHISIDVTGAPGSGATVDPVAVEQMVLNLVTNAREAMPRGGVLRIDVSPVAVKEGDARLAWMPPGRYVRLAVTDTGVGMDPATRARMFEPFFTTKPAGVGTGLGLSMVFGLAKQQQGFVDVETAPGKGTTVGLYFPQSGEGRRRDAATPAQGWRGGHETILLIEDDADLRRIGTRVLTRLGYTVLTASDGVEGLSIYRARGKEIHLVIADVVMPLLSGAEVYEAIRGGHPGIRFLFSSGYGAAAPPTGGLPPGVRLLPKPWTVEGIARQVRAVLDAE